MKGEVGRVNFRLNASGHRQARDSVEKGPDYFHP